MNALVEKYHISLSEAVRIGIAVMLSDMGDSQFLNRTNIGRELKIASQKIMELQQKIGEHNNVVVQ